MDSVDEKIRGIRLQLRKAKPSDDINPMIREVETLGHAGSVLIPEIIDAINRGGYPVGFVLVPVIVKHKSRALLETAMKRWEGRDLTIHDKAALFRAGFSQFQGELLDYLREVFDRDDDPSRSAIIEAFVESGTASLALDLEDIESCSTRKLKDMEAYDPELTEQQQLLRPFEIECRREFLAKLRHAIQRVRSRPDLTR